MFEEVLVGDDCEEVKEDIDGAVRSIVTVLVAVVKLAGPVFPELSVA